MSDMTLSEELQWRGFVNQTTFADLKELDNKQWTFYHGFDASAPSQTVGNLAGMMFDKVFMRHGHKAIILAGGATSLIGDPGGKDSERQLQDEQTIGANVARAEDQLKQIFRGFEFTMVNNLDWTRDMKVLDFLRDIGKHFSMTPLVQRDYIAKRLGEGGAGISYTEFSYTLLQGMDFLHLYDTMGATLQLGGADQWGNCLSGVDLIRRTRGVEAHVMTLPLIINKATGKKFGKSEEGAIWLDPERTSPYKFYQFWLNTDDDSAEDYLKVFTELEKGKIEQVMRDFNQNRNSRVAQKTLAFEVTKLVHGEEQAHRQVHIADAIAAQSLSALGDEELATLRQEMPAAKAAPGDSVAHLLQTVGLASSLTEARRLVAENAVSINGQKSQNESLDEDDFQNGRLLIRRGKAFKDSALVERG
ncbi:MAG TPA: tyrosine--tRNA ligase [Candidatus Pristimantibacillus sp.]|nr:tyrosine--tRNA ligase [Candidatus Pristimantibacillus sp.]